MKLVRRKEAHGTHLHHRFRRRPRSGGRTTLLSDGHEVIVHARSAERRAAVNDLIDRGASAVVGDLADLNQTRAVADQVNHLGRVDAVIHNAGIYSGPHIMPVNVVAPYLLTALIHRPQRLVYLSSGMHRRTSRRDRRGLERTAQDRLVFGQQTVRHHLAVAVARVWPDVYSNAVDPGWVPTRMGGRGAPDDLRLGHLTQEWLATSDEPDARSSGGYWFHQRLRAPHPAVGETLPRQLACRAGPFHSCPAELRPMPA